MEHISDCLDLQSEGKVTFGRRKIFDMTSMAVDEVVQVLQCTSSPIPRAGWGSQPQEASSFFVVMSPSCVFVSFINSEKVLPILAPPSIYLLFSLVKLLGVQYNHLFLFF